jgi:hypothetical protein
MMDRHDLIRRMVLNAICDDYENVDQVIFPQVAKSCAKLGFTVERCEIVNALADLIGSGLATAHLLSSTEPPKHVADMPPMEVVEENFMTYFLITKKGMDLHLSDDSWWPFDDAGRPRIDQ